MITGPPSRIDFFFSPTLPFFFCSPQKQSGKSLLTRCNGDAGPVSEPSSLAQRGAFSFRTLPRRAVNVFTSFIPLHPKKPNISAGFFLFPALVFKAPLISLPSFPSFQKTQHRASSIFFFVALLGSSGRLIDSSTPLSTSYRLDLTSVAGALLQEAMRLSPFRPPMIRPFLDGFLFLPPVVSLAPRCGNFFFVVESGTRFPHIVLHEAGPPPASPLIPPCHFKLVSPRIP